jgi:hypothetical protein
MIVGMRTQMTQRGVILILTLDDNSATVDVTIYSELRDAHKSLFKEDAFLAVLGKVSEDRFSGGLRITAEKLMDITAVRTQFGKQLSLRLPLNVAWPVLKETLTPYRSESGLPLIVRYQREGAALALFALAYSIPATGVAHRIAEAVSDVSLYFAQGNATTSVGIRLELWKASWIMFSSHPILGVGRDQFFPTLQMLAQQGVLPVSPALEFSSSHNDILHFLATGGLLDLSFLLFMYGAPLRIFLAVLNHPEGRSSSAAPVALAGVFLVMCFIGFGLTDVMFWLMIPKVFYGMMVCVLIGFCLPTLQTLKTPTSKISK